MHLPRYLCSTIRYYRTASVKDTMIVVVIIIAVVINALIGDDKMFYVVFTVRCWFNNLTTIPSSSMLRWPCGHCFPLPLSSFHLLCDSAFLPYPILFPKKRWFHCSLSRSHPLTSPPFIPSFLPRSYPNNTTLTFHFRSVPLHLARFILLIQPFPLGYSSWRTSPYKVPLSDCKKDIDKRSLHYFTSWS